MPEPLLDFVRQSIDAGNVQSAIEHVVGLLTAKATILVPRGCANEGFEKKLGGTILERGLQDLQLVGGAVLKRLPWTAGVWQQKLAAAQEPAGLKEIEEEVRSVLDGSRVRSRNWLFVGEVG